jgi:hypothetical protein
MITPSTNCGVADTYTTKTITFTLNNTGGKHAVRAIVMSAAITSCSFSADPVDFDDLAFEISSGCAPTTLRLNKTCDALTPDLADIYNENQPNYDDQIQIKWNISSIPAGVKIIDAQQCFYWAGKTSSPAPDNDVTVWRVNDQTWTESSSAATINAQALTNQSSLTWNSTTLNTWGCTNVTKMLQTDYSLGNKNASFRFEDPDFPLPSITNVFDEDTGYALNIGDADYTDLRGDDRECTLSSGRPPRLIITYTS